MRRWKDMRGVYRHSAGRYLAGIVPKVTLFMPCAGAVSDSLAGASPVDGFRRCCCGRRAVHVGGQDKRQTVQTRGYAIGCSGHDCDKDGPAPVRRVGRTDRANCTGNTYTDVPHIFGLFFLYRYLVKSGGRSIEARLG